MKWVLCACLKDVRENVPERQHDRVSEKEDWRKIKIRKIL